MVVRIVLAVLVLELFLAGALGLLRAMLPLLVLLACGVKVAE